MNKIIMDIIFYSSFQMLYVSSICIYHKNMIRSTAGRFIGKAKDVKGRDCKAIILSTREQHIRRDKATSNICSNQSLFAYQSLF